MPCTCAAVAPIMYPCKHLLLCAEQEEDFVERMSSNLFLRADSSQSRYHRRRLDRYGLLRDLISLVTLPGLSPISTGPTQIPNLVLGQALLSVYNPRNSTSLSRTTTLDKSRISLTRRSPRGDYPQ